MLSTQRIIELFEAVNEKLKQRDVIGEIGICGGAVMCLVYEARQATKDVDAIFQSQTTNIKRYIHEDFTRYDKVVKHLKRYQKQLKSHANNQTILSPNTHLKTVKKSGVVNEKNKS